MADRENESVGLEKNQCFDFEKMIDFRLSLPSFISLFHRVYFNLHPVAYDSHKV